MEEKQKKLRLTFKNGTVACLEGTAQQLREQLEFLIEQIEFTEKCQPNGNLLLLYVENEDKYIQAYIEEIEEETEE